MRYVLSWTRRRIGIIGSLFCQSVSKSDVTTHLDKLIFEKDDHHIFFGYYDKVPLKYNKLLAVCVEAGLDDSNLAGLGYFDVDDELQNVGEFKLLRETYLWNWQQGARLMWHPTLSDTVLYNCLENDKPVTTFHRLTDDHLEKIPYPLYDISNDGRYLLSLDFSELAHKRPGYGYPNIKPDMLPLELRSNIILYDVQAQAVKRVISKESMKDLLPEDIDFDYGYFNHLSFQPSSRHFLFYFISKNKSKRLTFAIVCSMETFELRVLSFSGFMSHYTWKGDDGLIVFTEQNGVKGYYEFNLKDPSVTPVEYYKKFSLDGHPTFNKSFLVTDCYPIWPTNKQKIFKLSPGLPPVVLASFQTPLSFTGEVRCDLHPRSFDRGIICDYASLKDNVRKMVMLKTDLN